MTKTPEQLEAEARELTGRGPLTIEELAEKFIDDFWHSAHERAYTTAIQDLIREGSDCGDDSAHELAASRWLESLRNRYEAGEQIALLDAINYCATESVLMPDWVASEFVRKYRRVASYEVKTLDEEFGPCIPENQQLAAMRRRYKMAVVVYYLTMIAWYEGTPRDEGLFEEIASQIGVRSKSTVSRYFYWFKNSPDLVVSTIRPQIDRSLEFWYRKFPKLDATFGKAKSRHTE